MLYKAKEYKTFTTSVAGIYCLSCITIQVILRVRSRVNIAKKKSVITGGLRYTGPNLFFLQIEINMKRSQMSCQTLITSQMLKAHLAGAISKK